MPKARGNQLPADYLDGAEQRVLDSLRMATDLSAATAIAPESYDDFPLRYHLCPDRSVLLRPFCFEGLKVLELGAGMGGVSRYIAEQCAHLTVVEATPARLAACRERLRDLSNWTAYPANLQDFSTDQRFDVVLLIGVLEYADIFVDAGAYKTAFDAVLAKAASLLTEDGVLFVAIENKLGLKYWAGASEDHSAHRFDSIAGYADRPVPRTFSRRELRTLLEEAQLGAIREYFPAADYKVPHSVLSLEMLEAAPAIATDVLSLRPAEDYATRRLMIFPDALGLETVAKAGLLPEFANSFLFVSARNAASPTLAKLTAAEAAGEIGWHYTLGHRGDPTVTTFYKASSEGGPVEVSKARLFAGHTVPSFSESPVIVWHGQERSAVETQPSILSVLRRHAYYSEWIAFESLVDRFFVWSFKHWSMRQTPLLKGPALDGIVTNALFDGKAFSLFDLEWEWGEGIARSWFIFRNVLSLHEIQQGSEGNFPYASLGDWYSALCKRHGIVPSLNADIESELALQKRICLYFDSEQAKLQLEAIFDSSFSCVDRINAGETSLEVTENQLINARAEIAALKTLTARLHSRPYRWAAYLMDLRERYPKVTGILKEAFLPGRHISLRVGLIAIIVIGPWLSMALLLAHQPRLSQVAEMSQAKQLFQKVDTNHDGKIDHNEWQSYVTRSDNQH